MFKGMRRYPTSAGWKPENDRLLQRGTNDTLKTVTVVDIEPIRYDTSVVREVNPWLNVILLGLGALTTIFLLAVPYLHDFLHHAK